MAKADLADTLDAIERQNTIMGALTEEQRQASLDRQRTVDSESIKRAQERAEEPDAFDDFDQHTLVPWLTCSTRWSREVGRTHQ